MAESKLMCLYKITDPPYISLDIVQDRDENTGDCFITTTTGTTRRVKPLYVGPVDADKLFEFGVEVINYIKRSRRIKNKFLRETGRIFNVDLKGVQNDGTGT